METPAKAREIMRHLIRHSIRSARRYRGLPMTIWNPRQIAAQNVDSQRGSHKDGSYPESPVTMHTPPVWPWIGFSNLTTISLMVVLASGHCFSKSDEYLPSRGAMFQRA